MEPQTTPLARARRLLETQGRFPGGALPGDISDSWLRSLAHGLDPLSSGTKAVHTEGELAVVRSRHADLIRFARPELELLYDQIAGSNFMIALGSPDGVVLETLTDTQFSDTEAGRSVISGSVWTEELRGTNALGLCLTTLRPAQVYGGEHFLRSHGDVSCISSPIFDGRGGLAGVLDASSGSAVRQQHTAALVQMSSSNIENCLIRAGHERRIILQFHPRPEYLSTLSVGMLVMDEDSTIHAVNRKGTVFLTGINAILGMPFDQIFEARFETIAPRLVQGETLRLRDRFGSAVSMRCVANRASFALAGRHLPAAAMTKSAVAANPFCNVVMEDPGLRHALFRLPEAARQGRPICFVGESGTGKEVFARLAHVAARNGRSFVVVDAATLAAGDAAASFFGANEHDGLLAEASGGSLFVAELAALPVAAQAALARLLDTGEYRHPVTGVLTKHDILFMCGSSVPLEAANLLPQLRYQLAECCIVLPPLRHRCDLAVLARRFAKAARDDADLAPGLSERLAAHDWPGNLHELRAVMTLAARRRTHGPVTATDLADLLPAQGEPAATQPCQNCLGTAWKEIQCREIQQSVYRHGGNIAKASRDLAMSRTTVYKHLPRI